MQTWLGRGDHLGYREEYLTEFLCWEGRGSADIESCASCMDAAETRDWDTLPVMRCDECGPGLLECVQCCLS